MKSLPPNSIIGILGGGQLGRMTALAAAKLGYRCHIFCPDKNEPAVGVSAFHTAAAYDDTNALKTFGNSVDVVTFEWENLPLSCLETVSSCVDVFPSSNVLRIAQDRELEKNFAQKVGVGTCNYSIVKSAQELKAALVKFKLPVILKSTRMGYDGKGQVKISSLNETDAAWMHINSTAGIIEEYIDFACEVSVIVAVRADGAMASYPVVQNIHRDHILAETHAPAYIDAKIIAEAEHAARKLAENIRCVGLLAVEFFVLKEPNSHGQRVLMNELAPRPHNSGHWTMDGCSCSQFEQLVRAVAGLPLGSTLPHSRIVMHNLIGDQVNLWRNYLEDSDASLHLYGKGDSRRGRKMGHVNLIKGTW